MSERILLTGHNGYIGSVMLPILLANGYDVVGLDIGYYNECLLTPRNSDLVSVRKDIRDLTASDLDGFDAVIHLAALSNDPVGSINILWTEQINYQSSVRLAQLAKNAGVKRFLFSSSCIMYGMSQVAVVTEESPLDPKTEYARSKVRSEHAIAGLADDSFSPTSLRNGTVYGLSPHMRFDTVLNNLVGMAVTAERIVLHGDGTPWRPVIHVLDVSRAFLHVLKAPIEVVHNQAFNNGADNMNYQIIELAGIVRELVPGCELECLNSQDADQRTYKTDFTKFSRAFPEFKFQWSAKQGAGQLIAVLNAMGLKHHDFIDKRYTRIKWLTYLLETGRLDDSLRWHN